MDAQGCSRRAFLGYAAAGALCAAAGAAEPATSSRKPNFIVVLTDDQGYGDVGCYGGTAFSTPNLDRMAAEGMRFTDFYAAAAVCTPSRAALMTGCYPQRVGLPQVLGPDARIGLNADETSLAELLKAQGYATACFGKWHLGSLPPFLPTRHGFDEYFGLPYSNDMWPRHPTATFPPLPLIDGEQTIERDPDQRLLTGRYTERAVRFIEAHKDEPFFLYLAHSMPHVPLHASEAYEGKSGAGLYGDVIQEIDASVGRLLDTLDRLGLSNDTLVVFSSDNGPWLSYGPHAGSAGPLREGKSTSFEGGQRVPCLARWPGRVPAGTVCREIAANIDWLPTIADFASAAVPSDRTIDGKSLRPLLSGEEGAKSPHEAFYYCRGAEVEAVRRGPWKLHLPHGYTHLAEPGRDGRPGKYVREQIGLALFNLEEDIGETTDVAAEHPEEVKRLQALAEAFAQDLARNSRPPGEVPETTTPA
jgi:arylsulfatase A